MKEFEKWLKKDDKISWLYDEEDTAELAWIAALDWVLEMFTTNEMHPPATLNVRQEIRDELKE